MLTTSVARGPQCLLDGRALLGVVGRRDIAKIAAQRLERIALLIDFRFGPNTEPPHQRDRRTPTVQGMLQQESGHKARNDEEAPVYESAQRQADQRDARRVSFEGTLDVPFLIEFREPA